MHVVDCRRREPHAVEAAHELLERRLQPEARVGEQAQGREQLLRRGPGRDAPREQEEDEGHERRLNRQSRGSSSTVPRR
jgi:hypothetical protein